MSFTHSFAQQQDSSDRIDPMPVLYRLSVWYVSLYWRVCSMKSQKKWVQGQRMIWDKGQSGIGNATVTWCTSCIQPVHLGLQLCVQTYCHLHMHACVFDYVHVSFVTF